MYGSVWQCEIYIDGSHLELGGNVSILECRFFFFFWQRCLVGDEGGMSCISLKARFEMEPFHEGIFARYNVK